MRTLCFDIGGTHLKGIILDDSGKKASERVHVPTPSPGAPETVLKALEGLASSLGQFDRVSAGFPGVVKHGKTFTAANLSPLWVNFPFARELSRRLKVPVRIANDADVQGLAAIRRKGIEALITFGTGVGFALYVDGRLVPNVQLGRHAFKKDKTYEDYLGVRAFKKNGPKKWNKHVFEMIDSVRSLFNFDHLYIGGGNAISIQGKLPPDAEIIDNIDGLLGGLDLWLDEHNETVDISRNKNEKISLSPRNVTTIRSVAIRPEKEKSEKLT